MQLGGLHEGSCEAAGELSGQGLNLEVTVCKPTVVHVLHGKNNLMNNGPNQLQAPLLVHWTACPCQQLSRTQVPCVSKQHGEEVHRTISTVLQGSVTADSPGPVVAVSPGSRLALRARCSRQS